jgi:hypothetical protein
MYIVAAFSAKGCSAVEPTAVTEVETLAGLEESGLCATGVPQAVSNTVVARTNDETNNKDFSKTFDFKTRI